MLNIIHLDELIINLDRKVATYWVAGKKKFAVNWSTKTVYFTLGKFSVLFVKMWKSVENTIFFRNFQNSLRDEYKEKY